MDGNFFPRRQDPTEVRNYKAIHRKITSSVSTIARPKEAVCAGSSWARSSSFDDVESGVGNLSYVGHLVQTQSREGQQHDPERPAQQGRTRITKKGVLGKDVYFGVLG